MELVVVLSARKEQESRCLGLTGTGVYIYIYIYIYTFLLDIDNEQRTEKKRNGPPVAGNC